MATEIKIKNIPEGYQFHTKSNSENWMVGWQPQYNLERGLSDYIPFLTPQ